MTLNDFIPSTLIRKARQYTRKLWVRVVMMGLLAVVAVGLTQLVEAFVPDKLARTLDGAAADRLLQIIANAMLAVTTFSLTVMVTVYRSSSTQWTPRVHRLIIQDRTTQNTLAVFIGAYVYSLLAIILREVGVYGDDRAFVLFVMTVLVLAIIVIYLIRWVLHLQDFGSLMDTTRQIEEVTREQFIDRLKNPCLGARPLTGNVPDEGDQVRADDSGYIQHIYPEALNDAGAAHGFDIYMLRTVGSFVHLNEPIAKVVRTGEPDEEKQDYDDIAKAVKDNVVLGDVRTYDQDPRFGLTVLGEIASKALSPGVNDPGTAIDVITRVGRILSNYKDETGNPRENPLDHLYVEPLNPGDLIEDGFGALARDGAKLIEVQHLLQETFRGLMQHPDKGLSDAARVASKVVLRRALETMDFYRDHERLRNVADGSVLQEVDADMEAGKGIDGRTFD